MYIRKMIPYDKREKMITANSMLKYAIEIAKIKYSYNKFIDRNNVKVAISNEGILEEVTLLRDQMYKEFMEKYGK